MEKSLFQVVVLFQLFFFLAQKVGAGAQKSGGAAALPAPPPLRSLPCCIMRLNFMPCETNHIWHYYFNLVVSSYVFVFMFYSAGLQALAKASRQLLVFNHVTRQPCWWTKQYNFVSHDLHEKRVQFPVERNTFVFVLQHGHRDVSWKPAIVWPSHPLLVSFATTHARITQR